MSMTFLFISKPLTGIGHIVSNHFEQQAASAIARNGSDIQKLQRQLIGYRQDNEALRKDHEKLMGQMRYLLEEVETLKIIL